jgi:hypothetical protein
MTPRARISLDVLRRSRFGGLAAVLLLLFQVVLSTDHLGAVAARATGMVADDAALGLLSLCGGHEASPLASAPTGSPAERDDCVLCSLATLASHGVAATAPVVEAPAPEPVALLVAVAPDTVVDRRPLLRHGTLRGPPAFPFA